MRILFVRHGQPDYATDTLTEMGKLQAEAVVPRLMGEGITEIYSSTMGRAKQTAEPFSKATGIPVTRLDFMREIVWGTDSKEEIAFGGHPWLFLPEYVKSGGSLMPWEWQKEEAFRDNVKLHKSVERVISGADAWLLELGFTREGEFYRVTGDNTDKTIAIFSHGGASTVLISHMLNIPLLSSFLVIRPYFTSVSVILLDGNKGDLTQAKVEILTDDRHVPRNADVGRIDNKVD